MNERSIFERALDFEDEASRKAFLVGACGTDDNLREQVEALLSAHIQTCRVLDDAVVPAIETDNLSSDLMAPVDCIGPYKIREKIGEGGMGVVYVAEQTEPVQRKVAVKVIKPGMDTKEVIARFEAERQALAFMEHPNIARVLDAGATESGRSYFVMELVRGIPITEYCDQVKATPRERLDLFKTVCDAVQHAHQKGIIHRDIKPSNVLVTQVGAKPVVKVIDFGLAKATSGQKLTDKTVYTGFMKLMGTPIYMSPEQAGLSGLDIDTRSDVYSLGVLLYELLTGTTPLDKTEIQKQAYDELCRQIREVEAPKPSSRLSTLKNAERSTIAQQRGIEPMGLRQLLDGDLDVVVLKALEKDRDRRYESPKDLAADIDRFLDDKPVQAVAPSQLYLAKKYYRRNRATILTAATVLTLLVLATVISTWLAFRATKAERTAANRLVDVTQARDQAENARAEARQQLYVNNIQLADQIWNSTNGTLRQVEDLLAAWIPVDDQPDLREFSWRYQWTRIHQGAKHTVRNTLTATISDSGYLITTGDNGVRQWDKSGRLVADCWTGDASHAILSPNGRWVAIPDVDETKLIDLRPSSNDHTNGDPVSGQDQSRSQTHRLPGTRVTFSPDSQLVACWEIDGEIATWNIASDSIQAAKSLNPLDANIVPEQGNLALASDGESYIVKGVAGGRTNLDAIAVLRNRKQPVVCRRDGTLAGACAWSADGTQFAVGNLTGKIHLYRTTQPEDSIVLSSHGKQITAMAFSPDGTKLASGGSDGTIDVWEIVGSEAPDSRLPTDAKKSRSTVTPTLQADRNDTPTLLRSIKATVNPVRSIAFSLDGREFASTDESNLTSRWLLDDDDAPVNVAAITAEDYGAGVGIGLDFVEGYVTVASVALGSPAADSDRVSRGDRILGLSRDADSAMLSFKGMNYGEVEELLDGPAGTFVRLHLLGGSNQSEEVVNLERKSYSKRIYRVTFEPSGRSLAIAGHRGTTVWNNRDRTAHRLPVRSRSVAYSPDGRLLAMDDQTRIVIWDLELDRLYAELQTGQRGRPMDFRAETRASLAFSPDGKYLAAGTGFPFNHSPKRSDLVVWDLSPLSTTNVNTVAGERLYKNEHVFADLRFSPDGKLLVTVDHNGVLRVWNTTTWSLQQTIELERRATALDISHDGKTLAIGFGRSLNSEQGIILWDFVTGAEQQTLSAQRPMGLAFSPDGRTLASTSESHTVDLWDVRSGRRLRSLGGHKDLVFGVAFSNDATKLATTDADGNLRIWGAAPLEQIDRDPQTHRALYRRGRRENRERRHADAKATLEHTLRLQQKRLPKNAIDISMTREQLDFAIEGLALKTAEPEHPPP